jgi:glycosyltransferase involved in cell wall biosynthesis
MKFIVYSAVSSENIGEYLGKPEYSYYFVLKKFLSIFEQLGETYSVHSFTDINKLVDAFREDNFFVVCCAPPNKSYINVNARVISVFAWEFDNLPNETWGGDSQQNWVSMLSQHIGAITLSSESRDVVSKSLGIDYQVAAIPVPIWDDFEKLYSEDSLPFKKLVSLEVDGSIISSSNYVCSDSGFEIDEKNIQVKRITSPPKVSLKFGIDSWAAGYLGGFYVPEEWGAWSKYDSPWILLPYRFDGRVKLSITLNAYENNIGRELFVSIAGQQKSFVPKLDFDTYVFEFDITEADCILRFAGIDVEAMPGVKDERSMGIGLDSLQIETMTSNVSLSKGLLKECVNISGVIYTTVFNPDDDRKNWSDIVKAFCFAFRENEDAVLILKITHHELGYFLGRFHELLSSIGDISCRIIIVHGYLDRTEFNKLIDATSYYINASKCEGLCMPLMEYMAAGKPAVATLNTAMNDYFSHNTGFVVDSYEEPSIWPHDPRLLSKTVKYRIDWMSLVDAYKESYKVAKNDSKKYGLLAAESYEAIKRFASFDIVLKSMSKFISDLVRLKG